MSGSSSATGPRAGASRAPGAGASRPPGAVGAGARPAGPAAGEPGPAGAPAWPPEPTPTARERLRLIALRLERALGAGAGRLVVVTSPSLRDGKTLLAGQLGRTLAHDLGLRVLLLDGDGGPAGLEAALGLPPGAEPEALAADEPPLVVPLAGDLSLAPLPPLRGAARARALLSTARRARARFDLLLADAPALAVSADAAAIGLDADAVIVVVRAGATRRDATAAALAALAGARIAGWVLTGSPGPSSDPSHRRDGGG